MTKEIKYYEACVRYYDRHLIAAKKKLRKAKSEYERRQKNG